MITQVESTVNKSILYIKELNLVYAMHFPLSNRWESGSHRLSWLKGILKCSERKQEIVSSAYLWLRIIQLEANNQVCIV